MSYSMTTINRRKSMGYGFNKLESLFDITDKFKIVKRYIRKSDDIDSQLTYMAISDGLQINSINIFSCIEVTRESLAVKYTEDFSQIIAGSVDGYLRIYDAKTMKLLEEIVDEDVAMKSPCTAVKHRPLNKINKGSNRVISTYASGFLKCWDLKEKKTFYTINENRQIFNLAYHPRLPKFVTCGDDAKILMYDEETKTLERTFRASESPGALDGHVMRVFATCFNPVSNYEFISGGWDNIICVWDVRQPTAVRQISGPHICGEGLDISEKGTEILSCAWQNEKQLCIWDYATGKLIEGHEPDQYNTKLYCGRFVSSGYVACGGSNPHLFRVVDIKSLMTMALINNLGGAVYSMDKGELRKFRNDRVKNPLNEVPRLLISSGKRIYQVDIQ